MTDLIVIPARFGSTRLPGKPLKIISGQTLLARVSSVAMQVRAAIDDVDVVVATDDVRIENHADELGLPCIMTKSEISSGSGRVLAAARVIGGNPRFILNLQGDAPFTTPEQIHAVLTQARSRDSEVTTPVIQLTWGALDVFRKRKKETPFSGTTCVRSKSGEAYWFSKNILPAIRKETDLRKKEIVSPVYQHIGLYCYRMDALERFQSASESLYEKLEGLEQLRLLELGIKIQTVVVESSRVLMSGIDCPEDVRRAELLIAKYGDPFKQWRALV